jgi:hypothetical protein
MSDIGVYIFLAAVAAAYLGIAWAVGSAAKSKGRSRAVWTTLSIFPLGPLAAPLWLATMPVIGEPASTKQLVGRTLLIAFIVLANLGQLVGGAVENRNNLRSQLEDLVLAENESTPMMVDDSTRLEKVELGEDLNLVYLFTLTEFNANEVSANELRELMRPILLKGVCSNSDLKSNLELGVTYTYRYNGRDGGLVADLKFAKPDCSEG